MITIKKHSTTTTTNYQWSNLRNTKNQENKTCEELKLQVQFKQYHDNITIPVYFPGGYKLKMIHFTIS